MKKSGVDMSLAKASVAFIEGFLNDFQPFMDMLKALGYVGEDMKITDKGTEVLNEYWKKKGVT